MKNHPCRRLEKAQGKFEKEELLIVDIKKEGETVKGNEQKAGNHGFHASRLHFYEVTFQYETGGSNFTLSKVA